MFSRLAGTAPLLLAALALVYQGATLFQQDLAYTRAQTELSFWGRGEYQPVRKTIERTGRTIDALVQQAPRHPEYRSLQARYFAWQAFWTNDMASRDVLNQQAVDAQFQGLLSRPAHRHSWSKMVEYASRTTTGQPMIDQAQQRLAALVAVQ